VADNLSNQNFNPVGPNQVWAGDITDLLTGEGLQLEATTERTAIPQ
jgi:transposase InsO family protein